MNRRAFLAGVSTSGAVGLAGCLEGVGLLNDSPGATDDVVLEKPELYEELRQSRDNGDLSYPIHADEVPAATVPDALSDQEVSSREYVGERHLLMTFIFARCSMVCPGLTATLAQIQADAAEYEYREELAFMPTTFDPEHDTPDVLETFCRDVGANTDHPQWHCLRPEGPDRATEVVEETFGVKFWRRTEEEIDEQDLEDNMVWGHTSMILLANADGYVERAYTGSRIPNAAGLLDDVTTLRERW